MLYDPEVAAVVVEEAVLWPDRCALWRPGVFVDPAHRDEQTAAAGTDVRHVANLGLRQPGEGGDGC